MATQNRKKKKFVADALFYAQLNEVLTRELAKDDIIHSPKEDDVKSTPAQLVAPAAPVKSTPLPKEDDMPAPAAPVPQTQITLK